MEILSQMPKLVRIPASRLAVLILAGLLASCSNPLLPTIVTPLPAEYLPTAVALTLAARGIGLQTATQAPTEPAEPTIAPEPSSTPPAIPTHTSMSQVIHTIAPTATVTFTPEPTLTPQDAVFNPTGSPGAELAGTTDTPTAKASQEQNLAALPGVDTPTSTPAPPIPDARIQIYRLGELSKIISPLEVSSRLTCGEGKVVRIDLYGEDGRLLARNMRTYTRIPWQAARIGLNLDFEINTAAELARLVLSAEDSFGRLIEVNSVNLILLSQGMIDLNPPSALGQRIIIQEPMEKAIIQGGSLIVSGRAKPETNQPLRVMLVAEDGRILGQRLAGVATSIPGDYGTFVAEVPYSVKEATPALLTVFEEGRPISEITFLTSLEVILAP